MNFISRWRERRRLERELADEMAEHLAERIADFREEGYAEVEARARAHRQFGNVTLRQEDSRAAWGWNTLEQFWQDVRFGCRVLGRTPGFTATIVIILALGIGMNTAMFSAVKAVLLSALPYPQPERMVRLGQTAKDGHVKQLVSGPDFRDWRAQSQTVESMATFAVWDATLSGSFPARRVRLGAVGAGFFDAMGTGAAIGRTFRAEEQRPGGTPTVVLGYELAQSVFGAPAGAIQRTVGLDGIAYTVIGVLPPKFNFPDNAQLWFPSDLLPDSSGRSAHNYRVVGRLKPGVPVGQAQADMDVVAARLAKEYADDKDQGIRVTPLYDSLVSGVRPALLVLLGAVTVVLLIACVNISNLQLARAAARRKEMAMRGALGAARGRLIRQLLTESVLLSGAGGLLGLALAKVAVTVLRTAAPANFPRIENLAIDTGVLGFTAGLSFLAGLLFGVLPSLEASRADAHDAMKQEAGKGTGVRRKRWAQTLVIAQIALAIVLLSGAGLLLKSYWKLAHVETGLASAGVFEAALTWPTAGNGSAMRWWAVDAAKVRQTGTQMLEQIGRLPGVQAAALIHGLPFEGAPDGSFEIEGRPLPSDPHQYPDADYRMATRDYFKGFGIPILRGRGFTADDERSADQVAIVNQAFQREFFPTGDALGQRIRFMGFDRRPQFMTIVGIIPDVRAVGLNRPAVSEVYSDYFQHAGSVLDVSLVVRGPASLQPAIGRIVTSLNPITAVSFESMDGLISGSIARERFQTALLSLFAACALLLSLVGVYGLLSYTVARRTGEMGLRMALGASSGSIARLVLGQGGLLVFAGVALGSAGSLLATRAVRSMVNDVTNAPGTLLVVIAGFAAAALFGCYLPARRASRIDPSEALRTE
jgi:predicted permease